MSVWQEEKADACRDRFKVTHMARKLENEKYARERIRDDINIYMPVWCSQFFFDE